MRHNIKSSMDDEEARMAVVLKSRAVASLAGRPLCLSALFITTTVQESFKFGRENAMLMTKGLPYYTKYINLGGEVWLWAQFSFNAEDFITSIELHHNKVPEGHVLNRKQKLYEVESETEVEFEVIKDPLDKLPLELWVQRDASKTRYDMK